MAMYNAHGTASVISNISVVDNRTVHISVRNFRAGDLKFEAYQLEVSLLLGKKDFCPQLDWVVTPSISV